MAARRRLEALVAEDPTTTQASYGLHALDLVLHGRAAFERSGWTWVQREGWLFVEDDPEWVRSAIAGAKGEFELDVRAVWLAGDAVVPALVAHARTVKRAEAPHLLASFSKIDSPALAPLLQLLEAKAGGATAKKAKAKPTPAAIEAAYDEVVATLVAEVKAVRGRPAEEANALKRAAERFMEIRTSYDAEPTEHMGHFFCVDGVGHETSRASAWELLAPTAEESERWMKVLDDVAR